MFGNRKMYKQGMIDAMQAYAGFSEKQKAALEKLRQDVESGNKRLDDALAGLGDELNGIYKYLNSREKAALYRLESSMDLKDLEEPEQQLLLAVLYQLADDEGDRLTDNQRAFIRSIQRYMGIANPQTSADLTAVSEIDSLDVQKVFLRVVLEFFYLQDGEYLTEEQEDFLGNFSVNKKQAGIIENSVSRLYNAVGAEGIAEKYGFTEEPEIIPDTKEVQMSEKAVITIDLDSEISEGEEKVFENQDIYINANIKCKGTLIFKDCDIYGDDKAKIDTGFCSGTVSMENCFVCNFNQIEANVVTDCVIGDCADISVGSASDSSFSDCEHIYIIHQSRNCAFTRVKFIRLGLFCTMDNCEFYWMKCDTKDKGIVEVGGCNTITHCSFDDVELRNGSYLFWSWSPSIDESTIEHCQFTNCRTDRADLKIYHFVIEKGIIRKKKIKVNVLKADTCTGLDKIGRLN